MTDVAKVQGGAQVPNTSYTNTDGVTVQGAGTPSSPISSDAMTQTMSSLSVGPASLEGSFKAAAAYPAGTPVYFAVVSGVTKATKGLATSLAASAIAGLLIEPTTLGGEVNLAHGGLLTFEDTATWDAVVQGASGGLVPGQPYYLNDDGSEKPITTTPATTSGHAVCGIGIGITANTMQILLSMPFIGSSP